MTKNEKKEKTADMVLVLLVVILLGGMALTALVGNSGSGHSYGSAGSGQSTNNQAIE